jgi:hypothetical protein
MPDDNRDNDPEFVDAVHKEVTRDLAAGNATKHFEDLFDSLNSNPSQQHNLEEAEQSTADREKEERAHQELCRAFKARLRTMLNTGESDGIMVTTVAKNIGGRGFIVYAKDRAGRGYDAAVDYDTMALEMMIDPRQAFGKACDLLARALLEARRKYHVRAGLS